MQMYVCVMQHRHESALAAEKEGSLKETELVHQRHEKALADLQVSFATLP